MVTSLITENVWSIRTLDRNRKLFDQLIPLPEGTSYNAYLIKGSEKTALIDTTYTPMIEDFINTLNEKTNKLDYIISNHSEQDHSSAIPRLLEVYPQAKVITNAKCKIMLIDSLAIPEDKFTVINDGETLSLGDKTLEFILAPWVHWPDTMFTYLKENKILFTCDFLGSHCADENLYVIDEAHTYKDAKRYYAEIMMPFRTHIKKHLEKLKNYDIKTIMTSHGPGYPRPEFMLDAYKDWASDEVKNEVVIAYVSMYNDTTRMVEHLAKSLRNKGITVKIFDLIKDDIGELAMELVDTATVVIGTPTVLTGAHPAAVYAAYLTNILRPKLKFATIVGSYGWGGNMVDQLKGLMGSLKAEFITPVVIKGLPKEGDFKLLDNLADEIAQKHKAIID